MVRGGTHGPNALPLCVGRLSFEFLDTGFVCQSLILRFGILRTLRFAVPSGSGAENIVSRIRMSQQLVETREKSHLRQ